jgi:hypothetical protein
VAQTSDFEYRTCPHCGVDCEPEPVEADRRLKIAFSCADHGLHTLIDPFEQTSR